MGKKPSLLDLDSVDLHNIVSDQEQIRKFNPHRFEMEMLSAVFFEDLEHLTCAAYQDVPLVPFWARGHMPGFPIMPGVLICEAAAQTVSYFATKLGYLKYGVVGLGALDEVRFRGAVRPGDRLILIIKILNVRHNTMTTEFEAVVDGSVVASGKIRGVAIPTDLHSEPEK